jgi:NADPH-dependent curcumin reductase CurA
MTVGRELHVVTYPVGEVQAGDFAVVETEVRAPRGGEVLVRNEWTSIDAALRLRLRRHAPAGYFSAFPLQTAMDGISTVGVVIESRADGFAPGDWVSHAAGWREYALVEAAQEALGGVGTLRLIDVSAAPPQAYLGPLGGSGLTAYAGLVHVAELRDGDIVWVSTAAGSVGLIAAQLAKLRGHCVVGSAGSSAKVAYLRDELGLDAVFDYKSGALPDLLAEAAPEGIDVYFDNVGGDHLAAALATLRPFGRVAMCGAISEYNASTPVAGPDNLFLAVARNLTLRGFRGSSYVRLRHDMESVIAPLLRDGLLKYPETIVEGLEHAPDALARLLRGDTIGKTVVRI